MTKKSVKIKLCGYNASDLARLLYQAANQVERQNTLDDVVIRDGNSFKVEMTINTGNAAFGLEEDSDRAEVIEQSVTEVCRILRAAAHKVTVSGWWNGQKLMDFNGNSVGQITAVD